jgi:hypothetical protein
LLDPGEWQAALAAGTVPFYRFRENTNKNAKYLYSTNRNEPPPSTWLYDGIAFYVYPDGSTPGTTALHRYRGNLGYFYTTNPNEGSGMTGVTYEGIAAYVYGTNPLVPTRPYLHIIFGGCVLSWVDNSSNESGFKIESRYGLELSFSLQLSFTLEL